MWITASICNERYSSYVYSPRSLMYFFGTRQKKVHCTFRCNLPYVRTFVSELNISKIWIKFTILTGGLKIFQFSFLSKRFLSLLSGYCTDPVNVLSDFFLERARGRSELLTLVQTNMDFYLRSINVNYI